MNPSVAPLLDDATAINTIAVLGFSALISVANCVVLFRRAFPKHFIANDSTIRFMSQRCQLLLLASALLLVDASNNITHFYYFWRYRTSYSLIGGRVIYLLSFPLTAPLLTHGTCQRCAVIISKYPEKQRRLIKSSNCACLVIAVATVGGGVAVLANLVGSNASASQWFSTPYIPVYISWSIAGYPLLAVVTSAWALSSSVRRNSEARKTSDQVEGSAIESGSMTSQTKSKDETPVIAPKRHHSLSLIIRKPSVASLVKLRQNARNPAGQLSYPLSSTFVLLSAANICLWVFVMYCATAGTSVGRLRSNAIMNLLASFGVAIETSFEFLVRKANQRQAASQRNADVHTFGMTTAGVDV